MCTTYFYVSQFTTEMTILTHPMTCTLKFVLYLCNVFCLEEKNVYGRQVIGQRRRIFFVLNKNILLQLRCTKCTPE